MVEAVKLNYPQREIADAAFELQREIESGERVLVGVNAFTDDGGESATEILRIDPALERKQLGRVQAVRARRDASEVERALAALRADAARPDANLMEPLLSCARARASEGEIIQALQQVFGSYTETPLY
jgi:methylmalonyl-CoA mutase N-terminal domain/subunit